MQSYSEICILLFYSVNVCRVPSTAFRISRDKSEYVQQKTNFSYGGCRHGE